MKKVMLKHWVGILGLLTIYSCTSTSQEGGHLYTNALVNESSPYLLQHAHNPVNWNPWGEAALAKAKEEDKLLVISVGYAACHWCHVMEHESFEDTLVARIMNEHFISIKVDREERPDVDDVYMAACQLATEQGCGWPLNAIALPDGRPIWAGTYFPRKQWVEILEYFVKEKEENGAKMEDYAANLTKTINAVSALAPVGQMPELKPENADNFAQSMLLGLDAERGGRKGSPKFPMPDIFSWLQEYAFFTGNEEARGVWKTTLDQLAAGGINDQLGGGFARYSTDDKWLVPHFEKMLYDNAQLVSLFSDAFAETGTSRYKEVVEETLTFIERELMDKQGVFYSSLDADSEGEEGKFYVWTTQEIDSLLSPASAELVKKHYRFTKHGNWEEEMNIMHYDPAADPLSAEELSTLKAAKALLLDARAQRVRPGLDDKVLTAWNGLMIKGYADAAAALQNEDYLKKAITAANFIDTKMKRKDGGLWRNYKDGKSSINAFLDDYALTSQAYLRLYELTFDESWLRKAEQLTTYALEHFSNPESDLLFYTSDLDPPLITRRTEIKDNVIAGSNSAFAQVLWQLGLFLDREDFSEQSQKMLAAVLASPEAIQTPSFYASWGELMLKMVYPPYEVAIVGERWQSLNHELQASYLPNALFLGGPDEGSLALLENKAVEEETFIYVCRNKICKLPVQTAEDAKALMD
ncbi:MAG: thioredoxin domain-containing protein [Lewinella sp.]|uniref:thioredoxin domain-containing protein n=1 Tax=Lewinella sp. TaxID=2004506 RepID=UPI003D6C2D81